MYRKDLQRRRRERVARESSTEYEDLRLNSVYEIIIFMRTFSRIQKLNLAKISFPYRAATARKYLRLP